MNQNFNAYSQYYDLLYKDKDYNAESEYIKNTIRQYKPKAKTLLELGAGTGKHAEILTEFGFSVTGIERSADMVSIAKKINNKNLEFHVADITQFKLADKFDVATSLFHVISYLTENTDLINTFKNVHNHLNEKGLFIFDVWYSPAVYHQTPEKRTKKLKSDSLEITRYATPEIHTNKNVVDVNYKIEIEELSTHKITEFEEKHPMRHFSTPEIDLLAISTGFKILNIEAFLTKEVPSVNTWGVCYVLQKI